MKVRLCCARSQFDLLAAFLPQHARPHLPFSMVPAVPKEVIECAQSQSDPDEADNGDTSLVTFCAKTSTQTSHDSETHLRLSQSRLNVPQYIALPPSPDQPRHRRPLPPPGCPNLAVKFTVAPHSNSWLPAHLFPFLSLLFLSLKNLRVYPQQTLLPPSLPPFTLFQFFQSAGTSDTTWGEWTRANCSGLPIGRGLPPEAREKL